MTATDTTEQTEQRGDADDDFEHEKPALEPHDFVLRAGLHGFDVFRLRPAQMPQPDLHDAAHRRAVIFHHA